MARVAFTNPPWYVEENGVHKHGLSAGCRWPSLGLGGGPHLEMLKNNSYLCYPFIMGWAASRAKQAGHEVAFMDAKAEFWKYSVFYAKVDQFDPEIAFVETASASIANDLKIAENLHGDGIRICLVGSHATVYPKEMIALPYVDWVITREYDETALDICAGAAPGIYEGVLTTDLDALPFPWLEMPTAPYYNDTFGYGDKMQYPQAQIWTTRGCPFSCFADGTILALPDKIVIPNEYVYSERIACGVEGHHHLSSVSEPRLLSQGKRLCVEVSLDNGTSLTVTPNHRITVVSVAEEKTELREAGEIQPGDWVVLEVGTNAVKDEVKLDLPVMAAKGKGNRDTNSKTLTFPETLNEDVAWVLGLLIGDGNIAKDGRPAVTFAVKDRTQDELQKRLLRTFGFEAAITSVNTTKKMRIASIYSKHFRRFIEETCGVDPYDKLRVPRILFRSPARIIKAFLEGLFLADGYWPKEGNPYLATSNKTLANEVAAMIHWIGGASSIYHFEQRSPLGNGGLFYRVVWTPPTFFNLDSGGKNGAGQNVPFHCRIYQSEKSGKYYRRTRPNNRTGVSRVLLAKLDPQHPLLNPSYVYVRVKSIAEVGLREVYDVSNPLTGMVSANGVLATNCSFCLPRWTQYNENGKSSYRQRSAENVLAEVDDRVQRLGMKHILYDDDTFSVVGREEPGSRGYDRVIGICDGMKKRGVEWSFMSRVDVNSVDLAKRMFDSGAIACKVGIESFSDKTLKGITKHLTGRQEIQFVEALVKIGYKVYLATMTFIPGEDENDRRQTTETLEYLGSLGVKWQRPHLTPLPGTPIFDQFKAAGYDMESDFTLFDGGAGKLHHVIEDYNRKLGVKGFETGRHTGHDEGGHFAGQPGLRGKAGASRE